MPITYDPSASAAYIYIVDRTDAGEAVDTRVTEDGLVLDFDKQGYLLGIEVLAAERVLRPETLAAARHPD